MFIQLIQGRAANPSGIRKELNRWQRQLAVDADGWLGSTAGTTEDGWSVVVMYFASEQQARRNSNRPEQRAWWRQASRHLGEVAFHQPGAHGEPRRRPGGCPGPRGAAHPGGDGG